jgi:hypothetical protein
MRDAIASRACRALFLLDGARAAKELNPLVARTPPAIARAVRTMASRGQAEA